MTQNLMGKVVTGAVACVLSLALAGDVSAGWGSSGGSWGSSGGSWGSSGGSWGSSGGSVGRWHAPRRASFSSGGSWGSSGGSSGGSWGSSGGSWGSSGGSSGVVTSGYVSPYIARPQSAAVAANPVTRANGNSARLTVSVPADARVFVNGKPTSSTGTVRQYTASNLSPGATYTYEVRAEATRGGQLVTRSQTVQLRSGETQSLAFHLEVPQTVETSLTVHVPEDAIVVLAGEATTATGAVRTFQTKALNAGQAWEDYAIQVSVVRNGQRLTQEKVIRLVGGQRESVRFAFGENQVAAR